ncbi:hypothetical protein JW886_07595 [Lactococcus taiwanensis]|uniref:Uncharacterized protein n=1 Tax=Lactococcus taiwanensis TaxID=1151742 RepID=A0AA45KFJ0_9LACT|nr:hypothetical protein [Lactococcus taiwanensis]QSE76324.1 hypothetical protein JW886_07595 [Lactococcus taiwanensis]
MTTISTILATISIIMPLIAIVFGLFIYNLLKEMPKMIGDKIKSEREFSFNKTLQIDQFYRKDGTLQTIMMQWAKYAMDPDFVEKSMSTPKGKKDLNELLQKTVGYGSPRTIALVSIMFQDLYNNEAVDIEETDGFTENGLGTLTILAMIFSSLKYDFTGQKIDELEIIKIKINDYVKYEPLFKARINEVNQRISSR